MILEDRIISLIGKSPRGPNCFNATVIFFDPTESIEYFSTYLMERWLKLNAWRVSVADGLQDGDILILYDRLSMIHSAVLIDKENMNFFHKAGFIQRWETTSYGSILDTYGDSMAYHQWFRVGSVISKV